MTSDNFTNWRKATYSGGDSNCVEVAAGRQAVDIADVLNILEALGVEDERWSALYVIAREAAETGWWDSIKSIGERQALSANLESGASTIRAYEQTYLPGLLQLPEYARSLHE